MTDYKLVEVVDFNYNGGTIGVLELIDQMVYVEHRGIETLQDLGLLQKGKEFYAKITDYGVLESVCPVEEYEEGEEW